MPAMMKRDYLSAIRKSNLDNSRQPSVNSPSDRCGNAVGRMRLLLSLPDQNDARFILDELTYCLPTQPPYLSQFSDSEVLLSEPFGVDGAWVIDNRAEMKGARYRLAVKRCAHSCLSSECRRSGRRGDLELKSVFGQICAGLLAIAMYRRLTEFGK
jgi:hypothetical protein